MFQETHCVTFTKVTKYLTSFHTLFLYPQLGRSLTEIQTQEPGGPGGRKVSNAEKRKKEKSHKKTQETRHPGLKRWELK